MEKMTYVNALDVAISAVADEVVKAKLEALKASIAKKNGAERKPTAQQTANVGLKADIVDFLKSNADKQYTITDLMKAVPSLAELSNQRVSAIVRQLKDEGSVERIEDKRKAYFKAIAE